MSILSSSCSGSLESRPYSALWTRQTRPSYEALEEDASGGVDAGARPGMERCQPVVNFRLMLQLELSVVERVAVVILESEAELEQV